MPFIPPRLAETRRWSGKELKYQPIAHEIGTIVGLHPGGSRASYLVDEGASKGRLHGEKGLCACEYYDGG